MPVRRSFILRLRRDRRARELARLLVALDRAAADARPLPARRSQVSFSK
jgi:hypothetical protein